MEIKVSEVMQREDNSLYLKEIEVINYDEVEILNTPDNVVKLMTYVLKERLILCIMYEIRS